MVMRGVGEERVILAFAGIFKGTLHAKLREREKEWIAVDQGCQRRASLV